MIIISSSSATTTTTADEYWDNVNVDAIEKWDRIEGIIKNSSCIIKNKEEITHTAEREKRKFKTGHQPRGHK